LNICSVKVKILENTCQELVFVLRKLLRSQTNVGGEIRERSLRRKAFWQLAAKSAFALLSAKVTKVNPAPKDRGWDLRK
jgi:hypothetical protein